MLLSEKAEYDDTSHTLRLIQKHDAQPVLDSVKLLRQGDVGKDSRHVGRVPFHIIEMWLQEAGVSFDDREAVQQVMDRKLMSGEFNAFRVWQGTY